MESKPSNGVSSITMQTANGSALPVKEDPSSSQSSCGLQCLKQNALTILTFLAVILGIALGFGLREARTWTPREILYVNYPGEIFLRMLRCLILPLIVSSLVSALGCLDTRLSGKIGFRAVTYYLATTVLAIILGIILVISIRPGGDGDSGSSHMPGKKPKPSTTEDTLMDLVRNMFPPNIIEACFAQYSTVLVEPEQQSMVENMTSFNSSGLGFNSSEIGLNSSEVEFNSPETNFTSSENATSEKDPDYRSWIIKNEMGGGTNILGLVVFSVVLGITLGKMKEAGKPLLDVFTSLSDAMMIITKLVIWFSPVGVLFLVAGKILEMDDLSKIAGQVGLYTGTVLAGLFIHGLVTLPLLYFIFVRRRPFQFMCNMLQAISTAFGTSSSSATLPVTIACLEEKNNVDPRVSRFCLPVGATINMDGTALYEAVAAIFIAQVRKMPLSIGSIIAISITSTAASIGAAGIPQAGLVTMVMVLNVVGLPADDVALIFVVDWFLDRFRTAINVLGDAFGAGIVAHLSKKDLAKLGNDELSNTEMTSM